MQLIRYLVHTFGVAYRAPRAAAAELEKRQTLLWEDGKGPSSPTEVAKD